MKGKAKPRFSKLGEYILDAQPGFAAGERSENGLLQLRMTSITGSGNIEFEGAVRIPKPKSGVGRYQLSSGDVLFGNTNSAELVGRAGVFHGYSEPVTFSNHLTRLRVDSTKMLPEWLAEFILSQWRAGVLRTVTTRFVGQSCIPTRALLELSLLPRSIEKQAKDVEALKALDDAIKLTRKITHQTHLLKCSLAQNLLANALTQKKFPTHTAKLGDLFSERNEPGRPGLPTIAVTMHDGIRDREDMDRRIESALAPEEHLLARKGDIAYNMMRMWQGVSGLVPQDSLVSPAYVVVTPTSDIDPAFAAHFFKLPETIRLFRRYSQGLTADRLRLYYHHFSQIPVTIPRRIEDQKRIANLLDTLDQNTAAQEATLAQLTRAKTAISNKIFSEL